VKEAAVKRFMLVLALIGLVTVAAQPAVAAPIPITPNTGPALDLLVPVAQAPWQPNLFKAIWTGDAASQTVGDVTSVRLMFEVEQGGHLALLLPAEVLSLSLTGPVSASWSGGAFVDHVFDTGGVYTLVLDIRQFGMGADGGANPFGKLALAPISAVPEPASILLLGVGLFGLAAGLRRVPKR
jgi:hypothetical protein